MAPTKTAFTLLAVIGPLAAQPLPVLRTEPVGGGSIFHIKNIAAQPLTAYLIELVDYPGSSYWLCQDDLSSPVPPGTVKDLHVTNMTVGAAPEYVKITASLYEDGSSAGPAEKVALIVGQRKSTLETTRDVISRIEKAQKSGTAKDAILVDLKQWAASLEPQKKSRRISPEDLAQTAARRTISNAADYLSRHTIQDTLAGLRAAERVVSDARQ